VVKIILQNNNNEHHTYLYGRGILGLDFLIAKDLYKLNFVY